jgi:lipopolysaccharide export system permease protein
MKILDRYIIKNFLYGYFIALFVMMGLFLTIDLFLNLDEFAEYSDYGVSVVLENIFRYYSVHCLLWYKNMAGMIMVIAAVFSLSRMTRNNELIAVMASGMSLKRLIAPILFMALLLSGLMVADQELVIPRLSHELTLKHDDLMGESVYDLWFTGDDNGSLISARSFEESTRTMYDPLIILRQKGDEPDTLFHVVGKIQAAKAVYDAEHSGWVLTGGQLLRLPVEGQDPVMSQRPEAVEFYPSNLTAADIPIRRREGFKDLLSLRQLTELENNPGARQTDLAELALQKNSRITDPIMNLILLMVALPVLVCRDPKAMKTAIGISFLTTASCFIVIFACKLFATEVVFGQIRPALWTWMPIFIFFPIAWIEIDSMRT